MTAIKSNKALKYNPIKPNEEGIIELKIVNISEYIDQRLFIITIQDSVINQELVNVSTLIRTDQISTPVLDENGDPVLDENGDPTVIITEQNVYEDIPTLQETSRKALNNRVKQLTFAEVDGLEDLLSESGIVLEGSYMERRLQLLQAGLLHITKTDEYPVYFSAPEDWENA